MPLIIDTYNVLHVTGVLPPEIAGVDTASLIDLIRLSRYRRRRVTLVCDGTPAEDAPTGRVGPITICYGGPGPTADALITAIIRRSSIPRRLTVVSSDRAVQREARRRRCGILSSEQFLQHLAVDHERAEASGIGRSGRSPAVGPGERGSTPPVGEGRASPLEAVLPPDLIREAESIVKEGLPAEEAMAAADRPEAPAKAADEANIVDREEPAGKQDDRSSPKRPRELVLPVSLLRQAEAMARRERSTRAAPASSAEPDAEEDRHQANERAEAGDLEAADFDPGLLTGEQAEDVLPPEVIAEAESLLPDAGPREQESEPGTEEDRNDRPRDTAR